MEGRSLELNSNERKAIDYLSSYNAMANHPWTDKWVTIGVLFLQMIATVDDLRE